MSWFQSLRDEFTLKPFEIQQQTHSDSAAMASGPPDVTANQEPAEVTEECSGKKKSKFQTFKKFFARKKRKEPPAAGADAGLKGSQSSDNVSKTSENNTLTRSEKEKGSGSKISLGSKALSHDSVFVSDSSEALGASQDSIHGKVKSLQLQLKQAIRLGSPPSLMCVKRTDDAGTMSEDDGLPCSPPEYTALHTVMNQAERNSSISMEGMDSDDDQLSCATSSRAVSPLVVPGDFSLPASPFGCLDNSAAKHKLGLRHKANNRRKPVSRVDLKAEGDSVVEEKLNTSVTDASEEREQQKTTEVVNGDELKPKVKREEEDEEEEEERPQHSRHSLLRDEEEREEEEDVSEAEQDVSHGPGSSSPPELCVSEEDVPDGQPLPSSKPSSRASSLDSPGATPEPPAGPREYLMDPPGIAYGAEVKGAESDLALSGEEDGVLENREEEEESSFLQEVLSSLKTPLTSCSLGMDTEGVVLEIEEEVKEQEREEVNIEDGEEVKEEVEQPVCDQADPDGSVLVTVLQEEEKEVAALSAPCQDAEEEEKVEDEEEEEAEEEEEEVVVEQVNQHGQEEEGAKEEAEEVTTEGQNDILTENTVNQAEEEERGGEEESEGEEAIELEKELEKELELEVEVEVEGWEKREEEGEAEERVEEAEEATEEERDDAEEMFPDAADEEEEVAVPMQEEDEGVDVGAVCIPQHTHDDETEPGDQVIESQAVLNQSLEEEREDGGEKVEEDVEIDHTEQKSEEEEDAEAKQPDADQTEQDLLQEDAEMSHLDMKQAEKDQNEANEQPNVSSKPSSLSLPESHDQPQPQESGTITPSKTTTLHINLLSPSSEKATSFFPSAAHPKESDTPSHSVEQNTTEEEEEEEPTTVEEEKQSAPEEEEATPPVPVEEEVKQPSGGSDQSKARFTIAPAWQRSQSIGDKEESSTPPSSPPACVSSSPSAVTGPAGVEVEAGKDQEVKAEPESPAKVELVLSPGRVRSAGTPTALSPSSSQPQTSTEEGNPDNPFGVRLRKTSVLHRFSSEEENTEPSATEPPAQPTSCRVESPQPISVKPSISQPVSIKPALPKKPEVHGDGGGKIKRMSDPAAARGGSAGSNSPSWISVAKQKQKIYKDNSLDEITVRKEEPERKSSLPMYVTSAASREHSSNTAESTGKVSPLEIKPSAPVEKESRRALSPPTPVPPQPAKPQSLPSPVPPKPQLPSAAAKPPPQRSLSSPAPVPVPLKSPSCTSPTSPSKTPTLTSPTFSSRTAPEKSASRGLPPPASPQDEPPWMALAKKKAKAWSEMPQIVQ